MAKRKARRKDTKKIKLKQFNDELASLEHNKEDMTRLTQITSSILVGLASGLVVSQYFKTPYTFMDLLVFSIMFAVIVLIVLCFNDLWYSKKLKKCLNEIEEKKRKINALQYD